MHGMLVVLDLDGYARCVQPSKRKARGISLAWCDVDGILTLSPSFLSPIPTYRKDRCDNLLALSSGAAPNGVRFGNVY